MDRTPTRASHMIDVRPDRTDEGDLQPLRVRKPPPVTPRRFNKFFTPRPRNAFNIRTSRRALRTISGSALNTRRALKAEDHDVELSVSNENIKSRKRRKLDALPTSPSSLAADLYLPSSQEQPQSSPIKYGDELPQVDELDAIKEITEEDLDVDEQTKSRIVSYSARGSSRNLLHTRLSGRRTKQSQRDTLWQTETANFYTTGTDVNTDFTNASTPSLPFSVSACHTNPIVATGDEDGWVRLVDSANAVQKEGRMKTPVLEMRPHDNALMDLDFSPDDSYLATASGDQTCQIIDMYTQKSLYILRNHTSSVKRIQFQPGSGNKVLASCGRDGQVCFWDLRARGGPSSQDRRKQIQTMPMAEGAQLINPVNVVNDAHTAGSKYKSIPNQTRPNNVPGRNDFSITSLSFLGESRSNLVVTASEVDTVIKIWDMRASHSYSSRSRHRLPTPISSTLEPACHEFHRQFGINSIALSSDCSRIYALSRDHTVYAYSSAHLILGSAPQLSTRSTKSMASRASESNAGLGPIYGFRHPSLRVSTFWPRLAIRKATEATNELLAVGSTDDCALVFPTTERHLTSSTQQIPALHDPDKQEPSSIAARPLTSRPQLQRSFSSSFSLLDESEHTVPIYYHGTPLVRGHIKEVTSLTWSSEGNLVTASDDYTIRCWRENAPMARKMRTGGSKDAMLSYRTGWADVGVPEYDISE